MTRYEGKLILASASPRRAELLRQVGCDFEVMVAGVKEPPRAEGESPKEYVKRLAQLKCAAIADENYDRAVLAADTIVTIDDMILGKPKSKADAKRMLRLLSGRTHEVLTGVAARREFVTMCGVETTRVTFRELSDREIESYVATGEPMDKAGAYGIQSRGILLVEGIEGEYSNVVGLPLPLVASLIGHLGIKLL